MVQPFGHESGSQRPFRMDIDFGLKNEEEKEWIVTRTQPRCKWSGTLEFHIKHAEARLSSYHSDLDMNKPNQVRYLAYSEFSPQFSYPLFSNRQLHILPLGHARRNLSSNTNINLSVTLHSSAGASHSRPKVCLARTTLPAEHCGL